MSHFFTSTTRISDLAEKPFDVQPLPRTEWATGDYVSAEVLGRANQLYKFELQNGRMIDVLEGDLAIGTLGKRAATLEGVGDWEHGGDDGRMHGLTSAGLFGRATSTSPFLPTFMELDYRGHALRDGTKVTMKDFVPQLPELELTIPVVLLIGTSMSSGKTTSGRIIVHELKKAGLKVAACKFTGAARYRDLLSLGDAGADYLCDFVDAGLPSTVCSEKEFNHAMQHMISMIAGTDADVLVAEAGASPLEPYNGSIAFENLRGNVRCLVLCASDPYAVMGVQKAFNTTPHLVAGPAANTEAGVQLVEKLTGVTALNLVRRSALPDLRKLLGERLDLPMA